MAAANELGPLNLRGYRDTHDIRREINVFSDAMSWISIHFYVYSNNQVASPNLSWRLATSETVIIIAVATKYSVNSHLITYHET